MHIPSSLSIVDVFYCLNNIIDYTYDCLVIGKPYASLAYHTVWNSKLDIITGYTNNVIWADSTIGNCLGVAVGLALSNKYRNVFVILSDASLQEGTVLESLLYIGLQKKLKHSNLIVLVDYNEQQCIGKNYISIQQMKKIISAFNFNAKIVNGHSIENISKQYQTLYNNTCFLFKTIKGYGIKKIQADPIQWHYKTLDLQDYSEIMKALQYEKCHR